MSWFDAARYANWLHNGQGTGDTETGAYTLNGATGGNAVARNTGAVVWIPTENEWFKAAYYDPTKGASGGYWLHGNQSDTMTTNTIGATGAANYFDGDFVGSGTRDSPTGNALTDVGAYGVDSQSFYGLNDVAGNVYEWNDLEGEPGSERGLRGGAWGTGLGFLRSSSRLTGGLAAPSSSATTVGFRVASVPEPEQPLTAEVATAIEFFFNSTLGKTYLIEESPDLSTWTPLESSIAGTGGEISRLYSTRSLPKRFLRVSEETP